MYQEVRHELFGDSPPVSSNAIFRDHVHRRSANGNTQQIPRNMLYLGKQRLISIFSTIGYLVTHLPIYREITLVKQSKHMIAIHLFLSQNNK